MLKSISTLGLGVSFLLICLFASGCATHMYTIKSDPPDAQITLNDKPVGKTPYTFPLDTLPRDHDSVIVLTKPGRTAVQAVIAGGEAPLLSSEVTLRLPEKEDDLQKLNRMSGLLWHAQKLSSRGMYPEAAVIVDNLLAEAPEFISAHLLKASILLLSKNVPLAEAEWKKVLEIDPANEEAARALRVVAKLEDRNMNANRSVSSTAPLAAQEPDTVTSSAKGLPETSKQVSNGAGK